MGIRHQRVQRLRKLIQKKASRDAERVFVVEGHNGVEAALASGTRIEAVYVSADALAQDSVHALVARADERGVRIQTLAADVLSRIADTATPQPIAAVAAMVDVPLRALRAESHLVLCVDVRDPGNLGSILRSADASGAAGVVCCGGTVDVYNPKVVRSSAGSLFNVPLVLHPGSVVGAVGAVRSAGWRLLATVARGGEIYWDCDLSDPVAMVLGNESWGLADEVVDACDGKLTVPITGKAESLNVAMAATLVCYECARQRRPPLH